MRTHFIALALMTFFFMAPTAYAQDAVIGPKGGDTQKGLHASLVAAQAGNAGHQLADAGPKSGSTSRGGTAFAQVASQTVSLSMPEQQTRAWYIGPKGGNVTRCWHVSV